MSAVFKAWTIFSGLSCMALFLWLIQPEFVTARNINEYRDTISNSRPLTPANHTLDFILNTTISPGAYIEITPPAGFEVVATSTFSADRNVELLVDGVARSATTTQTATTDMVELFPGSPGLIRYTLNTTEGISNGSRLQLRIGSHTTESLDYSESFSTTTGTTTTYADEPGIINTSVVGTHKVRVRVYDGGQVADADFSIAILQPVGITPIDTRETIPPFRFGGSPTSTVTGVTLNVEIFVQTDELAVCKYETVPGIDFAAMSNTFTNTGLIFHTAVVPVAPNTTQTFYVRCIDDEGNFNIDDYLIQFAVSDIPTGTANEEGNVQGDGTGSGDDGTGSGSGSGGETGDSSGEAPLLGGSSGTGGSGGGGGGGTGDRDGSTAGGGFESEDAPYRSGDGRVTITGIAFPGSDVVALVDGKEAVRERAGSDGVYSIVIDEIARGVYTFGVFAIDPAQNRSSTFSTSFTVTGARTSALSNINLSPSMKVEPDPVTPGQTLTISGYAQPQATITLENEREGSVASRQTFTIAANERGAWSTTINTTNFAVGTYKARARSSMAGGAPTNFSNFVFYGVGQAAVRPTNADLNRDGRVNLVDFSILLFWWNTDGGTSDPSADINSDGRVNLVDFSILLFNWTS